ncbi:hypothetical protein TPAR_05500 [Tolypocladium paradoxum]|uniref:Uncharacterized protein n=1 Tax=Tolypocladium paradoxum TaxID=94208 RepID=A0A2S4KVU2_9HYPO|nr:hypothetical protein TPAR_05500 [Tolypocladium paradoxum]
MSECVKPTGPSCFPLRNVVPNVHLRWCCVGGGAVPATACTYQNEAVLCWGPVRLEWEVHVFAGVCHWASSARLARKPGRRCPDGTGKVAAFSHDADGGPPPRLEVRCLVVMAVGTLQRGERLGQHAPPTLPPESSLAAIRSALAWQGLQQLGIAARSGRQSPTGVCPRGPRHAATCPGLAR